MVMSKNIKGVIFDVDGVLLDSMGIWEDLGLRYVKSLGLVPEEGLSRKLFSMSMEQGVDYLATNYSIGKTHVEIMQDLHDTLRDYYYYEVQAKSGARVFMDFLKERNIPMIAATSSPREHVTKALERVGLLQYIDSIFTTTEVGESKHSPLIYNMASQKLGESSQNVIVAEDSLYALTTASNAGYITVGVKDNGEKNQEGLRTISDLYVNDLSEAIALFG